MVVNHGESRCASGFESCYIMLNQSLGIKMWMLCQWVWIMLCYSELFVGNHDVNALPVGVNHDELRWTSGYESWCAMLSQCLWIIVNYAEPVILKHVELCWSSSCESFCYAGPDVWESWCAMMSQWWYIIVCYAEQGVCESWCAMLTSGWESRCERCASGYESCSAIRSQSL